MTAGHRGEAEIRVSVVIPTYNYGRYLPRAIESILAQENAAFEIIVADDGSTDDTAEIVQRYECVSYKRFMHAGVYTVRNAVLPYIRGSWYLNLDADNWLASDFLAQMIAVLREQASDSKLAFLYPDMMMHGESAGLKERPEFKLERLKLGNYLDMNAVIRTNVAKQFGFDPAFNDGQGDYDFFITLAKNGYRGCRVPQAMLHYEQHQDSLSRRASRQRRQLSIMRRIVRKHRDFFSSSEQKLAMAAAANRLMVAIINSRSPYAGLRARALDALFFCRAGWQHAECLQQLSYTFAPRRYLAKHQEAGGIFYLYRDTIQRRALLRQVESRLLSVGAREQLFGYDVLKNNGKMVHHNLRYERVPTIADTVLDWRERRHVASKGIGLGDVRSIDVHRSLINRSACVIATADTVGLPLLRAASAGGIKPPLVYISIGWPERVEALREHHPKLEKQYRKWFLRAAQILAYGYEEAKWLRHWLSDRVPVSFLPFGVDTEYWREEAAGGEQPAYDLISVGADLKRDYDLFLNFAQSHPHIRCALVSGRQNAPASGNYPPNVEHFVEVSVDKTKSLLSQSRVVMLPIKENRYSGGTTTLLQAMALGRPVAVSRVGAIAGGYGFVGDQHVCWMNPGDQDSFNDAAIRLLKDQQYNQSLAEQGRLHVVSNFSLDCFARRLLSLLPLSESVSK